MISIKKLFLVFSAVIFVGVVAFTLVPHIQIAQAAVDAYLTIDGMKGSSTASGHTGAIEVASWSFGASNPTTVGSGSGAGSGKVAISSFNFMKSTDKASALLAKAKSSGKRIANVTLSIPLSGQGNLTLTMQDVLVSSYSTSSGGDRPMESVSFNFTKIIVTYGSSGAAAPTTTRLLPTVNK